MGLEPLQLSRIAQRIKGGFCVPILGAAANIESTPRNYTGLRLGKAVSQELAKAIIDAIHDGDKAITDTQNLPKVSFVYEVLLNRQSLVDKVRDLLPEAGCAPSHLLEVLAALPFELYITTNYDRLLELALKAANREPMVVVQTAQTLEGRELIDEWSVTPAGQRRPLVYKIHGTFKEPVVDANNKKRDYSPLIITEDDYIDFLTLLGSKEHGVPKKIGEMLKDSDLLFLGYSLEDWDFRALYKVVMGAFDANGFPPLRYSVQWEPPSYWNKFWSKEGIEVVDQDVYAFADDLKSAFEAIPP